MRCIKCRKGRKTKKGLCKSCRQDYCEICKNQNCTHHFNNFFDSDSVSSISTKSPE